MRKQVTVAVVALALSVLAIALVLANHHSKISQHEWCSQYSQVAGDPTDEGRSAALKAQDVSEPTIKRFGDLFSEHYSTGEADSLVGAMETLVAYSAAMSVCQAS